MNEIIAQVKSSRFVLPWQVKNMAKKAFPVAIVEGWLPSREFIIKIKTEEPIGCAIDLLKEIFPDVKFKGRRSGPPFFGERKNYVPPLSPESQLELQEIEEKYPGIFV